MKTYQFSQFVAYQFGSFYRNPPATAENEKLSLIQLELVFRIFPRWNSETSCTPVVFCQTGSALEIS